MLIYRLPVEIEEARKSIDDIIRNLGPREFTDPQKCTLHGMLCALDWVMNKRNGEALQRAIDERVNQER